MDRWGVMLQSLFKRPRRRLALVAYCLVFAPLALAEDEATIELRDGSTIKGKILKMDAGEMQVDTTFGGTVPVKWSEVVGFSSDLKLRLRLPEGSYLNGTVERGEEESILVHADGIADPVELELSAVNAINVEPVTYKGFLNFGGTATDGNTRTKAASANAEFVARSKRQRLTLRGAWNYAEDRGELTARNARGGIKYDFFFSERWYLWVSTLFEGDEFQDLQLRSAFTGGLGYQFLERGEAASEVLKRMEGYAELGAGFFNEDFSTAEDDRYASLRWALRVDFEALPGRVYLFHFHEGFPGLENTEDVYINTEQGVRLTVWAGFNATFQVNWRWDNTPAPGNRRSDTMYLATLGYAFSL